MTDIRDTAAYRQVLLAAVAGVRDTAAYRQVLYSGSAGLRVTAIHRQVLMVNDTLTPEEGYEVLPDPVVVQPSTQALPTFKPLLRRSDVKKVLNSFGASMQSYLQGVVDKTGGQTLRQKPIDANGHNIQVGSTTALPYSAVTLGYLDQVL